MSIAERLVTTPANQHAVPALRPSSVIVNCVCVCVSRACEVISFCASFPSLRRPVPSAVAAYSLALLPVEIVSNNNNNRSSERERVRSKSKEEEGCS